MIKLTNGFFSVLDHDVIRIQFVFPTFFVLLQKLLSLIKPSLARYPPMHLNLSLYKDMLKNIPLGSAEDYQNFLNLTSPNYTTSNSQAPLSSTLTEPGTSPQKGFWRNLSFARKSTKATTVPSRKLNAKDSCAVEMDPLLQKKTNEKKNPPLDSEPKEVSSGDPVVNERPEIVPETDPINGIEVAPDTE